MVSNSYKATSAISNMMQFSVRENSLRTTQDLMSQTQTGASSSHSSYET